MAINCDEEKDLTTVQESFVFQNESSLSNAIIHLAVALKVSGATVTKLDVTHQGGLSIANFDVEGTRHETEVFLVAYCL
jgi:hypothetical protein